MVLGNAAGATCAQISSPDAVRATTAAHTMRLQYLDMRLYYAAVQNLVYGCGNVPQTTVQSSNTPPKHCDQYVQ